MVVILVVNKEFILLDFIRQWVDSLNLTKRSLCEIPIF